MEITTPNIQVHNAIYGRDHLFDLEAGMSVYGAGGAKIGIVTEVSGFGSTLLGAVPSEGADDRVTQAQSSTGFFKVKRDATESSGTPDLCIPFHAIHEVSGRHGVIVNGTFDSGLHATGEPAGHHSETVSTARAGGWRKWLPGHKV